MATADKALEAIRTTVETFIGRYGEDLVLAALREVLAPHLTPEAVERANAAADAAERAKFGSE